MASNQRHSDGRGGGRSGGSGGGSGTPGARAPEWADGLKQLYDSVVEEDLPDSFKDLLSRLDGIDSDRSRNTAGPSGDGRETSQ